MKTNLSGLDAYFKMMEAVVPEKTDSYTPISHFQVFQTLRKEIKAANCIISGEDYKCTDDRTYSGVETQGGQVAIGMVKIKYGADSDLELTCAFLNSYNKKFAFRFALGAHVTASGAALMLQNNFKRVHTGEADIFAVGTISNLISEVGDHWKEIIERKDKMKLLEVTKPQMHDLLGELYFQQDLLTGFQLNVIKKELHRLANSGVVNLTAWQLYNVVAEGIKETHPAEWLDVHVRTSEVFNAVFDLDGTGTHSISAAAASLPGEEEDDDLDIVVGHDYSGESDEENEVA